MAHVNSQVVLYDTTGAQQGIYTSWNSLLIQRRLNGVDTHMFMIRADDPLLPVWYQPDSIMEFKRSVEGSPWYTEYVGFNRSDDNQFSQGRRPLYTTWGRGLVDLVHRREILYAARTAGSLKSGPGELVMKEYVYENVGPGASSPLRRRNGVTLGFTVEATTGLGAAWHGQRTWVNVLDVVQDIALATGVDFDVVRTGPVSWEFRTYWPQKGTDRSSNVIFSLQHGNMYEPHYARSRMEEANVVVVLGQGEETARQSVVREDTVARAASPWNTIEVTHDARNEDSLAGLNLAGDTKLKELTAQETFAFKVQQAGNLLYGRDYFLGDLVTARYGAVTEQVKKITGVDITVSAEQREEINVLFSDDSLR